MKRRTLTLTVALWLVCLGGCATLGPKSPSVPGALQPNSSGIAISLKTRAPLALITRLPDGAFFVRTDEASGITQPRLVRSNYAKDGRVYLLNVPPGSYAAVASFNVQDGRTYIAYFPKDLIEQTRVTVGPGEVAFMGHYVVSTSVGLSEADPIQLHYSNLIAPGAAKSGFGIFFSGAYQYRGSIDEAKRDLETRNAFLANAKQDLADGGWTAALDPVSRTTDPLSDPRGWVKVTESNARAQWPTYSLVMPADRGWHARKDERAERVFAELRHGPPAAATFLMQFAKVAVLDERVKAWSARQVADDFRNKEKGIMIGQGVMREQYRLSDVVMGEEQVGDKNFYTMKYTTTSSEQTQTATLYLHFPRPEKHTYFILCHYSETLPPGTVIAGSVYDAVREEFLQTLKSLLVTMSENR